MKNIELFKFYLKHIKSWGIAFLSWFFRHFTTVKEGRVYFEANGGGKYNCNPKYLSEYILEHNPNDYEIIWILTYVADSSEIDKRVKIVHTPSWKVIYYLNTSEFVITNYRMGYHWTKWRKREYQKYIMTWHGDMIIKKIELDAANTLPSKYIESIKKDSRATDLMLSDSKWFTGLTKRAFNYYGEVLEHGIPRNDIFFSKEKMETLKKKVFGYYGIEENVKLILYAPTFRDDYGINQYIMDWDEILRSFEKRFNSKCVVLVRIHPGIKDKIDASVLVKNNNVIDATDYNDMQELICALDVLITDYSSTMFEAALAKKPCFLFVKDAKTYNRGMYFSLDQLPFPYACDIPSFIQIIDSFDLEKYQKSVKYMFSETFHYVQDGNASKNLVEWMEAHSINNKVNN